MNNTTTTTPNTDDFFNTTAPEERPAPRMGSGTGGATTEKPERFTIDSEKAASWLLSKLRAIEDEKAAIEDATRQRLDELTADYNHLMNRFSGELENWARGEAETRRRKTITLPLAGSSVAFRTVPARVELTDTASEIATTLGFMKAPTPDLSAFRKHAEAQLKETGELIPGATMREAEERFYIKTPKAKGGDTSDPNE